MNSTEPILILRDLELRSRGQAFGLPEQTAAKEAWHGIGFRLGVINFVVPLAQVNEVLVSPVVSRVPAAKEWVVGIANVRGTLVPVFDLNGFLNRESATAPKPRNRALVVDHGGISAALLVDEVAGLKHFFNDERTDALPDLPGKILGYIAGGFLQGGEVWAIFDMHRLVLDPEFMQVAA